MAEIKFAAGALKVMPVREPFAGAAAGPKPGCFPTIAAEAAPDKVQSAQAIGGCAMVDTPELGVVRPGGRRRQSQNMSVQDGSLFPTSIGANPQVSVYGLADMLATPLASPLGGRSVQRA